MSIRGRPPSEQEKKHYEAATARTPERSLEKAEALANFVFANVAVVGTLLTGLGLVADDGALLQRAPKILSIPVPVCLVGVSLVLAIVALLPSLSRINPARVSDVGAWYESQIRRRGIAVILALLAFAGAIITATVAVSDGAASDPRISADWTGTTRKATATVKAQITGLAESATARMAVRGVKRRDERDALFKAATRADASGAMAVEATVAGVGRYRAIAVRFIVRDGSEVIEDTRLLLRRPKRAK